jgi:hypothetical protein
LVWNWSRYQVAFHLLLGAAYSFHVTLTIYILHTRQSDITQNGHLFSACVIFIGNILVMLIGLPLLTQSVDLTDVLKWWINDTTAIWSGLWHWTTRTIHP